MFKPAAVGLFCDVPVDITVPCGGVPAIPDGRLYEMDRRAPCMISGTVTATRNGKFDDLVAGALRITGHIRIM